MTRYKLKKDLPTFNAGDIFKLNKSGDLIFDPLDKRDYVMAYNHLTLEKFPNILTDWFEEIEEEVGWKPYTSEEYWYIHLGADRVCCSVWMDDEIDSHRFDAGVVFKTREEAQKAFDKSRAYRIICQDAKGFKPDWQNRDQQKWVGIYNHDEDEFRVDDVYMYQDLGQIYFATQEDVQESFTTHRKEWLTLFEVEE